MQISSLTIRNLRCIKELTLDLGSEVVLVGPNNVGKTAILEAIRVLLTRRWGRRGSGFTELDIRRTGAAFDPRTAPPIEVEATFVESAKGEWPPAVHDTLFDIIQADMVTGAGKIVIRVASQYEPSTKTYETRWTFLGADGKPTASRGRAVNLYADFFDFVPVFYLSALRDSKDEFGQRSPLWATILRSMEISPELEAELTASLEDFDAKLTASDPRLAGIATTIGQASTGQPDPNLVNIRSIPFSARDVLARAEVHLRRTPDASWLPLGCQGQGTQSLAVLFLFDAYVNHLLQSEFKPESTPVLALEEPEVHLHPQSARALWKRITSMKGQKLIASHSPFFVQHVPISSLRLIRAGTDGPTVSYVRTQVSAEDVINDDVRELVAQHPSVLSVNSRTLFARQPIRHSLLKKLYACFVDPATRSAYHARLKRLRGDSLGLIEQKELDRLETFGRRIRGEIFFASCWLICEGASDHLLLHTAAAQLGKSLDESGVAVIDCQNNGSAAIFAQLAHALGIPWFALFDNDPGGSGCVSNIENVGFDATEVTQRCYRLSEANLETELVLGGLGQTLIQIATELGATLTDLGSDDALIKFLQKHKAIYPVRLAERIRATTGVLPTRLTDAVTKALEAASWQKSLS